MTSDSHGGNGHYDNPQQIVPTPRNSEIPLPEIPVFPYRPGQIHLVDIPPEVRSDWESRQGWARCLPPENLDPRHEDAYWHFIGRELTEDEIDAGWRSYWNGAREIYYVVEPDDDDEAQARTTQCRCRLRV